MPVPVDNAVSLDRLAPIGSDESAGKPVAADDRLDDLAQVIRAYNEVTERLQASHESLKDQVVRLQQELASTNAKLQRSKRLAALGEMAAGIAHEIRNPLAAIQLYAGVLFDTAMDCDVNKGSSAESNQVVVADTSEKIVSAVRGLDAIVNDVLTFARELSPSPISTPVSDLFDRAVEACGPLIAAAGVTVIRQDRQGGIASGSEVRVNVDPALMHQALLNLIRNAVDAMSDRKAEQSAQLTLDVRQEGAQIVLVARDTGGGIAERDVDRIFNPFFTTRNTGTGLGLAIVHRIVDAHSGTISVHNDGGAVFELSLPVVVGCEATESDCDCCELQISAVAAWVSEG